MGDRDLPPMYSRFSLPSSQTVPVYTECAQRQERVLHSEPVSPVWSRSSSDREYCYETDHVVITLSRSPWGLQYAAFGREAIVDGTIRFTKNCSHVLQITVKVRRLSRPELPLRSFLFAHMCFTTFPVGSLKVLLRIHHPKMLQSPCRG